MQLVNNFGHSLSTLETLLGNQYLKAVQTAYNFLRETSREELRTMVGKRLEFIPDFESMDKHTFATGYQKPIQDDILTGYGMFKVTEAKVLQIDWTSGHYQLPLGYHFPKLESLLSEARNSGIVDDTHNNTPGQAVKLLASQLIRCVNIYDGEVDDKKLNSIMKDDERLNRVISVDTGTVATGAALKSVLYRFRELYRQCIPVLIVQEGNYHGTDFLEQRLRGMWEWLFNNVIIEYVQPNNIDNLNLVFRKYANNSEAKIAAVMMEPVLMNNRAIHLKPEYVYEAKSLCVQSDTILFLDEIQTGLWSPSVFMTNEYQGVADAIAVGKGLTAGFSPLAYFVCKQPLDNQEQYSSISTNGNADMAALVGLIVLETVKNNAEHIKVVGNYYFHELQKLQRRHSEIVLEITGHRHLSGINIVNESLANKFHKACIAQGVFVRLQTYKQGACTIITKPPVIVDTDDVDFVIDKLDAVLRTC